MHKILVHQYLVGGYFAVTFICAIIFMLPVSTVDHSGLNFTDAIFLASSGISTTGLSTIDVGSQLTFFGQIVLMALFQIGGLGYMTYIIFIAYILGLKISYLTDTIAKESVSGSEYDSLKIFFFAVLTITFIFEVCGAAILTASWQKQLGLKNAFYHGVFHSISTFCTAGFSLNSDSMMKFQNNTVINCTIIILSLIGGIGFFVIEDIRGYFKKILKKEYPRSISTHTKTVIIFTILIITYGSLVILLNEKWTDDISIYNRIIISIFQSVSASTTDGFNSIDVSAMTQISLFMLIILMFVGAAPGSTGGGIKISTFAAIFRYSTGQLFGDSGRIFFFKRTIPAQTILKAFGIFFWFILIIVIDLMIMSITDKASFLEMFFEIISALGNAGLSMGITAKLSVAAKLVLALTMFIGRVGPIAFGFFIASRRTENETTFKYAEDDIFVG